MTDRIYLKDARGDSTLEDLSMIISTWFNQIFLEELMSKSPSMPYIFKISKGRKYIYIKDT